MLAPDTVRAHAVTRLLQAAAEEGLDRQDLLVLGGFTEDDLKDPDRHVSFLKWVGLWREVCDRIPDPDFGLRVGQMSEVKAGGVLGYAMYHSSTLGSAIRRLQRFSRILITTLEIRLEEDQDAWRMYSRRPSPQPMFRQLIDAASAGLLTSFREMAGEQLNPIEVRFTYPRPADVTALRRFYRCDLIFDEPIGGSVTFRAQDMDLPTQAPEGRLSRYLDRLAEQELAALPRAETFLSLIHI